MKVKKNGLCFERWYWGSCWRIMKLLDWLFQASCYSLVHVRAELTPPLYDKLVFILQQIYILWYRCVLSVRWETEPWQKGNYKGIKPFGMVKEAILWGITDFNIRNSGATCWLQWGALAYWTKLFNWNKKPWAALKGILKGFSMCFSSEVINKPYTEYCFLHVMEGSELSHWFQQNEIDS